MDTTSKEPSLNTKTVVAANGGTFCARLLFKGGSYGLGFQLIHGEDAPILEFYDVKHPHTPYGQFITRYYVHTLLDHAASVGLDMMGDVPGWKLDAESLALVMDWVKTKI